MFPSAREMDLIDYMLEVMERMQRSNQQTMEQMRRNYQESREPFQELKGVYVKI